jgi:hypothetical protein
MLGFARNFTPLHTVRIGSGVHPAAYPIGIRIKDRNVKLTTLLHVVPRAKTVELYLHSL